MFADVEVLNVRASLEVVDDGIGGAVRKVESASGGVVHITRLGRRLGDKKCDREGAGGGGPTRGEFVAAIASAAALAGGGPRGGGEGALSFRARAVMTERATRVVVAAAAAECSLRPGMFTRS